MNKEMFDNFLENNNAKELFYENNKKQNLLYDEDIFYSSFDWTESPQRHDYWLNIHYEWYSLIKKQKAKEDVVRKLSKNDMLNCSLQKALIFIRLT